MNDASSAKDKCSMCDRDVLDHGGRYSSHGRTYCGECFKGEVRPKQASRNVAKAREGWIEKQHAEFRRLRATRDSLKGEVASLRAERSRLLEEIGAAKIYRVPWWKRLSKLFGGGLCTAPTRFCGR